MCGFFGVYRRDGGLASGGNAIAAAGRTLAHRGPDDEGIFCDEHFGVHFRRLSIIDLSAAGHQPMLSADGRYVLVFNGEIYNYRELREELKRHGHKFHGDSDSEVLLAAFAQWGTDSVQRLRGMFAFVVWDRRTQTLYACRDRLGIKPLYVCRSGGNVLFSSEIKAILAYAPEARRTNERSVFKYLARGWVDDTEETFYAGITSVLPGTVLRIESGRETSSRYWTPAVGAGRKFDVEEFRNVFSETVALHLRSDVPLAATLSGGMDSSSIVALAARGSAAPDAIQTVSMIPPQTVDESFWIDRTVAKSGVKHTYLEPAWAQMASTFDDVLAAHDEPFQESSAVYQYLLRAEVASLGIKVLLVGEGGDEVLGGYRRLFFPYLYALQEDGRDDVIEQALANAPAFLGIDRDSAVMQLGAYRATLSSGASGQENSSAYDLLNEKFVAEHRDVVAAKAYPPLESGGPSRFFAHLIQHLTCRDIPYVLRMEDRNSMAHGVEARVPFLDHILLEYVFSCDYAEFMREGQNKAMLRQAMRGLLPDEVVNRRDKSPRPGSNVHFMYDVLDDRMNDILSSPEFSRQPWFGKMCADQFRQDRATRNSQRAEVWFRIYSVSRWLSLNS